MRISLKLFLSIVCIFFFVHNGHAQKTTAQKPVTVSTKFKPPKLSTFWGTYKDSVTVPVAAALDILALPLKIYDDKKVEYIVSSYQFLYRKRTVTEDEVTGKVSPATSMVSALFTQTPLSNIWINQIREQLKAGEELYFLDVIAKDAQGRVMYASNLKILTQ